jgi:DNA-binding transcriptional LysR family regulator
MRIPQTSIEQWAVLRVIVESGGFAQAAEQLHRSQSSVSYAVARLQERLGIELLQVIGRKAHLTETGKTLLAESAPLIDDLLRLEERARFLAAGNEARIRLLVDSIFPKQRLFAALATFETSYPHVRIDLRELVRQTALDVASEQFDLAISAWSPQMPGGQRLADIELLAVAHRDHPLLQRRAPTRATLSRFRRVLIQRENAADEAALLPQQEGPFWRVNTVETAIEAVTSGLCYGWLPRHLIADALEAGILVALPLAAHASRFLPLMLSHGEPDRVGPAARALAELLLAAEHPTS